MIPGETACPMNHAASCDLSCPAACGAAAIVLAEARARFEREAVRGVCDTGRYRMPYFSWGEGPPLLFVHGLGDSSRSFLMPIARLSAHFRCIAYDQPRGGTDGARLGSYTHAQLVGDVWTLLDHLGIQQTYLLASSFGGTIALEALRQQPRRLPRAVLQGGLAHRPLRRAEWLVAHLARLLPGRVARVPGRKRLLRLINRGLFDDRPAEVWEYFLECSGEPRIRSVAWQALLLHRLDLRPILPQVRQPVLLVCGDRDQVVPPAYQEVLLQGLPNAGRAILQDCGHVPSYTHPEVFAEVVREFFTPKN
jgi:pimeloyl-ACP methyl ester carboxylesterase